MSEEELINLVEVMLNDDPNTIRLGNKGIKELPVEFINFITIDYKIERLGLEQNQLTTLPQEICNLAHLRYLNISYNAFKEFPGALCSMKNLEILDLSRNKIRKMPEDFGTLMSLKLLKMSKNHIRQIPLYISEMKDLQYLKLDNNPIVFPPKSVHIMPKGEEKEVMLPWLENLKEYLRKHSSNYSSIAIKENDVDESDHSSGEEDLHNKGLKKSTSSDSINFIMNTRTNTGDNPNSHLKTITEDENVSSKIKKQTITPLINERKKQIPKLSLDLPAIRNRSYSSDDPSILHNVQKNLARHSKSFSSDSISSSTNNSNHLSYHGGHYNDQYYIVEEKESDSYFTRLKNLLPSEHLPMSDVSLREASRCILYAFSQIHKALRQFANFTGSEKLFFNELNKASKTLGQLSNNLCKFDSISLQSPPETELCEKLLGSCQENILCFKQLIDILNKRLKGIVTQSSDNMRYSRTLLLMLNGSIADIKFAWEILFPLLNDYTPYTGISGGIAIPTPLYSAGVNSNGSISPYNLNTPSTTGLPSPYLYNENGINSNGLSASSIIGVGIERTISSSPLPDIRFPVNIFEQLLSKVDVSIKNVEYVVKYLSENLDQFLTTSTNSDPAGGGEGGEELSLNKIKELRNLVKNTMDVTRRLKKSLLVARLSSSQKEELSVQLKVHGDSIVFLQTTVKMSSLAKEVSLEFPLPNKIMSGLGHVTKTNIDLTNFLRAIENNPTGLSTAQYPSTLLVQDNSSVTFLSNDPLSSSPIPTPNQSPPHSKSNSINEIDKDIKPCMIVTTDDDGDKEIEVTEIGNEDENKES
ncbi:13296_t:CDS:2 [Funneliformis caledonium]|uniref:13296_t:CDS:1 n=1 Tax=Funneliformis caledonium TaxID=1117310 RepID=A0A9N9BH74_9GLOM|nr:13296_t:CDS:2 [Funneliformis caledonium]